VWRVSEGKVPMTTRSQFCAATLVVLILTFAILGCETKSDADLPNNRHPDD
jgi:hypothetical protein